MVSAPDPTPVTTPDPLTVAIVLLEDVQVPPVVASVRLTVPPIQTEDEPDMAATESTPTLTDWLT